MSFVEEPSVVFSRTFPPELIRVLPGATIGDGTVIYPFVIVMGGARIGSSCKLESFTLIENGVILGDRVTVKTHCSLYAGLVVEDDVFIGSQVTTCNDSFPRSNAKKRPEQILIKRGASIGAGATILPGVTVGAGAMVGAGSVVAKDVPAGAIVAGNPARLVRSLL